MGSKQKNRSGKRIFLIVLIILVTTLGGALLFYSNGIGATSMTSKNVTVTIKQGSTSYEVLEQLDEAGLVNSRLAGRIYMKFCAPDNLKANVYAFNKNMTLEEIIRAISIADKKYLLHKKFTVIEGSTIPQAAVKIADITGASKKKVLKQWSDRNYLKTLIDKYWFFAFLASDEIGVLPPFITVEVGAFTEKGYAEILKIVQELGPKHLIVNGTKQYQYGNNSSRKPGLS